MSIESVMLSDHLTLLLSVFPSIRVFSSELPLHIRWPKYWSFGFSISPSNEYSGLISFRMDWFGFLSVQGMLKCLFQHVFSSLFQFKSFSLQHSAFFRAQLSHLYMITGKNYSFDYTDPCQHTLEQAKCMFIPLACMKPLGQGSPLWHLWIKLDSPEKVATDTHSSGGD